MVVGFFECWTNMTSAFAMVVGYVAPTEGHGPEKQGPKVSNVSSSTTSQFELDTPLPYIAILLLYFWYCCVICCLTLDMDSVKKSGIVFCSEYGMEVWILKKTIIAWQWEMRYDAIRFGPPGIPGAGSSSQYERSNVQIRISRQPWDRILLSTCVKRRSIQKGG